MNKAQFPSPRFPDFPSISVEVPEGWTPSSVPGTLMAVVKQRGPEEFSPNVVITASRGVGTSWEEAETAVDEYVLGLAEVESTPRERVVLSDRRWSVLEFAHVSAAVGTVFQVIGVSLVENGPFTDSIRVTGSAAPVDVRELASVIRGIIASTEISLR